MKTLVIIIATMISMSIFAQEHDDPECEPEMTCGDQMLIGPISPANILTTNTAEYDACVSDCKTEGFSSEYCSEACNHLKVSYVRLIEKI